ncbi:MAG: TVP38/TMEM64 family protein, partial [Nitrospiraceae bacterium]|nr:TVP38/TMEM64 family protein [Nitrospiraceae bacterium]
ILFLFPGFPKDFLCYFLGLSRMPWQAFLAIVILGRTPGTLALTLQGADIYKGNMMGFFIVFIVSILVLVPSWYYRERIYQWVEAHSLKDRG